MVLHDIALVIFDPIDNDQFGSCTVTEQYALHLPISEHEYPSHINPSHLQISLLPHTLTPQTHPFTP